MKSELKKIIKKTIVKTFNHSFIQKKLNHVNTGSRILFYHGIESEIINPRIQPIHLRFESFQKQIKYLEQNFHIISIDELYNRIKNNYKIDSRSIVITFDDGYKNNLEIVMPFLNSKKIPFSVFISTNHIDSGKRFPTYILRVAFFENPNSIIEIPFLKKTYDISSQILQNYGYQEVSRLIKTFPQEKADKIIEDIQNSLHLNYWQEMNDKYYSDQPMNWADVDELNKNNITIGSHCHDHSILHGNQMKSDVINQLKTSKEIIENRYGSCQFFCYPNGLFKDISYDAYSEVKRQFSLGLTTAMGVVLKTTNKSLIPRIIAPENFEEFKFNLNYSVIRNSFYKKEYLKFINN